MNGKILKCSRINSLKPNPIIQLTETSTIKIEDHAGQIGKINANNCVNLK